MILNWNGAYQMDPPDSNEERRASVAPQSILTPGDSLDVEKIDGAVGFRTDPIDSMVQWGLVWADASGDSGDLVGSVDSNLLDDSIWSDLQTWQVVGNTATGLAVIDIALHLEETMDSFADGDKKPHNQPNSVVWGIVLWFKSTAQYNLQWDVKAPARKTISWREYSEQASDWDGYQTEETAMYLPEDINQ